MKHELGDVLHHIRLWEHAKIGKPLFHRRPLKLSHRTFAQRLRTAIEELGPVYIKLAQMLASRPDILTGELHSELEKLEDHVQFIPASQTRSVIEADLGRPINEIFTSFDDTPIAAASLAQVHRARLGEDEVVVKVQRPDIKDIVGVDLDVLRTLAEVADRFSEQLRPYNPKGIVEGFAENITRELDFLAEAANMKHFAANFAQYPYVRVPRVYEELCTRRVLVMEYLNGIPVANAAQLKEAGYSAARIATRGVQIMLKSVLEDGFFHADPHPGNMLILPGDIIGMVDFGIMGTLSARTRSRLVKLIFFILMRDETRLARTLLDLSGAEGRDAHEIEEDVARVLQEHTIADNQFDLGILLVDLVRLIVAHRAPLPGHLLLLAKSVGETEAIAENLGIRVDVLEQARPFVRRRVVGALNPLRPLRGLYLWITEWFTFASELPGDIRTAIHRFTTGQVRIEFHHTGLEPLTRSVSRLATRLALAFIICTLLLTSAILVLAKLPPLIGGMPVLGFVGFLLAILLGLILAVSVALERRER